ncbi:DUF4225 domain-containing protein [bacterium]|nr:DUF4225 domain-containing protein [bacterium]
MADYVSAGTEMAAMLQTAGYFAQSEILAHLGWMFDQIGVVILLGCAIFAIVSFVVYGRADATKWFLLGPPLFIWILSSRIEAHGTKWQFGTFDRGTPNAAEVFPSMEGKQIKVSWAFHQWDLFVSELSRQLIDMLTKSSEKPDLLFNVRQQVMDKVMSSRVADPGLLELIHLSMRGQCAENTNLIQRMVDIETQDLYRKYKNPTDRGGLSPEEVRAAEALERDWNATKYQLDLKSGSRENKLSESARNYVRGNLTIIEKTGTASASAPTDVSYDECIGITGTELAKMNLDLACSNGAACTEEPSEFYDNVSCAHIWNWVYLGAKQEACGAITEAIDGSLTTNAQQPELRVEVAKELLSKLTNGSGGEAPSAYLPQIVAGYFIRNELTRDPSRNWASTLHQHLSIDGIEYDYKIKTEYENNVPGDFSKNEDIYKGSRLLREALDSYTHRFTLYSTAMAMPYFQGVLLYILALLFPFFCIFILVPGFAGAFFIWPALWMWVKFWDVGFAMVKVLDEFLWEIMPHANYDWRSAMEGTGEITRAPVDALRVAFGYDPGYSLSNYYHILSVALVSIPVVFGQAILGGKAALVSPFLNGAKALGQKRGADADMMYGSYQAGVIDKLREKYAVKTVKNRLRKGQVARTGRRELLGIKEQIDATEASQSQNLINGGVGMVLGGVATVAGVICCFTGVGAVVGAPLIGAGVGAMASSGMSTAGAMIDKRRLANQGRAGYTKLNARMLYQDLQKDRSYQAFDMYRAAVTDRIEFWNLPDVDSQSIAKLATFATEMQAKTGSIDTHQIGKMLGDTAELAEIGSWFSGKGGGPKPGGVGTP